MERIKAIAFDCDGVVLDSAKNVYRAYQLIFEHFGIKCQSSLEKFKKDYADRTWVDFLDWMGVKKEDVKKADEIFKESYGKTKPLPFEGIRETLSELSDTYPLFLVTTSHESDIRRLFVEYGLSDFFHGIRGSSNPGKYCGKTKNLLEIMGQRNLMPNELVLVGDREMDFLEAREAGMDKVILVEYGWGYNPDKVSGYKLKTRVDEPLDILTAIEEIEARA